MDYAREIHSRLINHLTSSIVFDACDVGLCNPQMCLVTLSEYLFKFLTLIFVFFKRVIPDQVHSFMNHAV